MMLTQEDLRLPKPQRNIRFLDWQAERLADVTRGLRRQIAEARQNDQFIDPELVEFKLLEMERDLLGMQRTMGLPMRVSAADRDALNQRWRDLFIKLSRDA